MLAFFEHAKLLILMEKHPSTDTQYYSCVIQLKTFE